jgi:hypothetical protein
VATTHLAGPKSHREQIVRASVTMGNQVWHLRRNLHIPS